MILYGTQVGGTQYDMGTSGFLFRSNKLMYDKATQSLWSTLWGKPVVGPLVGKGIALEPMSIVTTTWGAWRERHPDSKVLALDTGFQRNYDEGAAYRSYFATDELMFPVPDTDDRLLNKKEILALAFTGGPPVAVSVEYLAANPVWTTTVGLTRLLVLTDDSGANRVYAAGSIDFVSWDSKNDLTDSSGTHWFVSEHALTREDGEQLLRLPAHRAFWFGWRAAYPATELIH